MLFSYSRARKEKQRKKKDSGGRKGRKKNPTPQHFQVRGSAFAVIPTSGRAVSPAYTAAMHGTSSHLVPQASL